MRGVTRDFERPRFVRALTGVSFEVRRGQVLGLLGPSGSGKLVMIRILAGRLSQTDGKARVFGRSPRRRSAKARVGYLPERPSHTRSPLLAEVTGLLRDLFVWRKHSRPEPTDLLPGNKRLLLLKQLLLKNPELLLLDEPFAGLDAAGRAELRNLIATSAGQGKTILLTSDSLTDVNDICDRFALYSAGQIEALGSLEEILATTDAIRAIGAVLPQQTAQRVLGVLREELGRPGLATEPSSPVPQADRPVAAPAAPVANQAMVPATADDVLAPLVGGPGKAASDQVREQVVSPVNNERLAALTKPALSAAADQPKKTT